MEENNPKTRWIYGLQWIQTWPDTKTWKRVRIRTTRRKTQENQEIKIKKKEEI